MKLHDERTASPDQGHFRFPDEPPKIQSSAIVTQNVDGRTVEYLTFGDSQSLAKQIEAHAAEDQQTEALNLEEIFLLTAKNHSRYDFSRN